MVDTMAGNWKSVQGLEDVVWVKIMKDVSEGRLVGPFLLSH